MKYLLRRLRIARLAPIMPSAVPVSTFRSPLGAKAERISLALIEKLATRRDLIRIGAAFDRFLGETRGNLALKKALHLALEERMRVLSLLVDPPEAYGFDALPSAYSPHPLDRVAAAGLDFAAPARPRVVDSVWLALSSVLQGVALLIQAVRIYLIKPPSHCLPRSFRVGAPAFGNFAYWEPVLRAITETRPVTPDDLAVVIEGGYGLDPGPEIPVIRPADCRIDPARWRREVIWPAARLVIFIVAHALSRPLDPVRATVAWFTCHLARTTLDFQRVLHCVTFASYLDIMEYSPTHIVKAAILRRNGGRLVRWPHCYLDNPGATLSYLGYHLWLGTGSYESATYGKSWAPDCARDAVGFFKNDRRWYEGKTQLDPDFAKVIEAHRSAGRKLLAYFGPSAVPDMVPIVKSTLEAVVSAVSDAPEWFVIVKAKGYGAFRMIAQAVTNSETARALEAEGRLIVVPYTAERTETCSAGWLIRQMAMGVGLGSVQLEGLTQGKPVFSYLPVAQVTPYRQRLSACGLTHTDPSELQVALERWINGRENFHIPFNWFRDAFDPYSDDQALSRIVGHLWTDNAAARPNSSARTSDR